MKRRHVQQFEVGFDSEPFALVAELATDQERIEQEREAKRKAKAEAEARQVLMFN